MLETAPKKMSRRKAETRTAILNAAEEIFAARGYAGTSIRDICKHADVNSGLVAYYFRNKDGLFEQVIERRCDVLLAMFDSGITAIDISEPGIDSARSLLTTYCEFLLRLVADDEWRFYIRLLGKSAGAYDEEIVGFMLKRFDPMPAQLHALMCIALPDRDKDKLRKAIFYLEAALSTIIAGDHLLDRRLDLKSHEAHIELAREIASFYAERL